MFLYNRQSCNIINTDFVYKIFIGRDDGSVAIANANSVSKIAVYDTDAEAREAIEMLAEHIRVNGDKIFYFPDNETVRARVINRKFERSRLKGGKKEKGHGGS